jgi:23S rRNA (pseudouridine1915-N3)-methyltransferase
MKVTLAAVVPRQSRSKSEATDRLFADYLERIARYVPCESQLFDSEAAILDWLDRQAGRTPAYAILLDSRGRQYTSE